MEENQLSPTNIPSDSNSASQTIAPQSSPASTPQKPKGKKPLLAIIGSVIFLLIAGGAAAGFLFKDKIANLVSKPSPTSPVTVSPTTKPDPTANWKTYISDEVSFKYPSDMEVFPCGMMGVDQITSVGIKKINDNTTYCGIGGLPAIFTISTYGENKTIENYLTKLPLGTNQTISPIQYGEINGVKFGFTALSTEGGFSSQTHALINPTNNKLYYIHSNKDWKTNEIMLDQILSTFKFID